MELPAGTSAELATPRAPDPSGQDPALSTMQNRKLRKVEEGQPLRMGVISGLGYRNLKGDLERTTRFLSDISHVPHRVVKTKEEAAAALDEFRDLEIDVVTASGGDGTVSMVVTDLLNRREANDRPYVAVLQGGRTNMTARDIGIRGKQIASIEKLLKWTAAPKETRHSIIERAAIGVASGNEAPSCGFFVGGGAIYHGSLKTWGFRDKSRIPGMTTGFGTAASVVKLVTSHIVSRSAFPASHAKLEIDGTQHPEDQWCVFMASTLSSLALGLNPFWGKGDGPIRLVAVAHEHRKFIRAFTGAVRGKQTRHMTPEMGYHSHNSHKIVAKLDGGVTLDGELIHPKDGQLVFDVAGTLPFVRL